MFFGQTKEIYAPNPPKLYIVDLEINDFNFVNSFQVLDDKINEFDIWHGLANLYASLSRWKDAEICLQKARELKKYSAAVMHTQGKNKIFVLFYVCYLSMLNLTLTPPYFKSLASCIEGALGEHLLDSNKLFSYFAVWFGRCFV